MAMLVGGDDGTVVLVAGDDGTAVLVGGDDDTVVLVGKDEGAWVPPGCGVGEVVGARAGERAAAAGGRSWEWLSHP